MNCPFCKSEYQSELLQEGRCAKCGGVVEWKGGDTDDFDASKFQPKVTVDLSPRMQSQIRAQSHKSKNGNGDHGIKSNSKSEVAPTSSDRSQGVVESQPGSASPDLPENSDVVDQKAANSDSTVRIDGEALREHLDNGNSSTEAPSPQDDQNAAGPDSAGPSKTTEIAKGQALDKSTDLGKKIRHAWSSAAAGIKNTYSTIRTDQSYEDEGSSIRVVINERRMKGDDLRSFSPDYSLLNQIGQGAVGVVYAAQQNSVDREVAVKMLQGNAPASDDRKEKFLFEAVVTGDLDHPNIVPIHELGKNQKGDLFYSMKKIEGQPWSESIHAKSLAVNLDILLKVCDAIAFAHSRGIIHRDLKPENIMLGEYGEVLVVDWGIALPIPGYSKTQLLKFKPSISGTPAYMAPEMATGPVEKIGVTSDVYLLGAILFEMITGKPPHHGQDALQCVLAAASNVIVDVPTEQEPISIARKAMLTDPDERYSSVSKFKDALNSYQSHVESISLSDRAEASFETAKQSKDYQDFSKALFAYEEALELWPANKQAILGIRQTNYEFARCALEKSDFDLGLSRVDENDKESRALGRQLRKGAQARDRRKSMVKSLRNVALGLVLLIIAGGSFAFVYQQRLLNDTRLAEQEASQMLVERNKSLEMSKKALAGEKQANERSKNSLMKEEKAKQAAEAAKEDAVKAKEAAQENLEKLEEATYATNLDVAGERIEQNAFNAARVLVTDMATRNPGLLHWEWGRINHLCNELSDVIKMGDPTQVDEIIVIDRIRQATAGELLAVGEKTGRFHLLFPDEIRKELSLAVEEDESATLTDLKFEPQGNWLAVSGQIEKRAADNQIVKVGVVRLWNLNQLDDAPRKIPNHGSAVTAITFDAKGRFLITAADDNSIKRWSLPELKLLDEYSGHRSQVHDIDVDPAGKQFVTAGEKDVRIWKVGTNRPIRRYPEHRCPVFCVRFIENGEVVLSGDSQGRLFKWTVEKSSFLDFDDSPQKSSLIEQTRERVKRLSSSGELNDGKLVRDLSDTKILQAHKNTIRQISLSGSGDYFLTAADDNVVRVWNAKMDSKAFTQWRPAKELRGHGGQVLTAVFGLEDRTVFSGGQDKQLRKWNIDGTVDFGIQQVRNQGGRNLSVSISPDHNWLAFGKTDGTTVLQNIKSPADQKILSAGHDYLSNSTVLTPDRQKLITAAGDNTARVWDFEKGTETKVIEDTGRRGLLCLAGDGKSFATGTSRGDAIRVFDVVKTEEIRKFTSPPQVVDGNEQTLDFSAADLSFNGRYLLAGDSYGHCYLWEVATGNKVATWKSHFAGIVKVAFVGKEDDLSSLRFVTAGRESVIALWQVEKRQASSDEATRQIKLNEQVALSKSIVSQSNNQILSQVVFDENRNELVAIRIDKKKDDLDSSVTLESLDLITLESNTASLENATVHAACYLDKMNLLIAMIDGQKKSRLYSWIPGQGRQPIPFIEGKDFSGVSQMVIVRQTNQLLTVGGKGVQRWDLESGDLEMDYRSHAQTSASVFSSDGLFLVTGGSEGAATLWNTKTGKQAARLQHSDLKAITAILFTDETTFYLTDQGGNLFSASIGNQAEDSCQLRHTHSSPLTAICQSEITGLIYAGGNDGQIIVWNEETQELDAMWTADESINCLAMSPNGHILAVGTQSNTINLWSVEQESVMAKVAGHSAAIRSLQFSMDGLRLLSAAVDGNAILWDLTPTLRMETAAAVVEESATGSRQAEISELFSLRSSSNDLLTAQFVNEGADILLANSEGYSRVQGSQMQPAFRLTRNAVEMERGSKMPIDSTLTFSIPAVPPSIHVKVQIALLGEDEKEYDKGTFFDFEENKSSPVHVVKSDNQLNLSVRGKPDLNVGEWNNENGRLEMTMRLEPRYLFLLNDVMRSIVLNSENIAGEKVTLRIRMQDISEEEQKAGPNDIQEGKIIIRLNEQRSNDPLAKADVLRLASPVNGVQGQ